MTVNTKVVLWNPARTSVPTAPGFSRPLAEPILRSIATRTALQALGCRIV